METISDKIIQITALQGGLIVALTENGNIYTRYLNSKEWELVCGSPVIELKLKKEKEDETK